MAEDRSPTEQEGRHKETILRAWEICTPFLYLFNLRQLPDVSFLRELKLLF